LGIYSCASDALTVPGLVSAYLLLMILPGSAFYILANNRPTPLELALSSVVLSPVLTGVPAVVLMALAVSAQMTAVAVASASAMLGAVALFSKPAVVEVDRENGWTGVSGRQALVLVAIIAVFCVLVGYHPFVSEWWRMRTDGFFHIAVISQIEQYGIPPEDPYFHGMPLQYMWFFHVMAIVVTEATNIQPSFTMPLFNIQALAGYILATFLLSVQFRRRFAFGISSVLTALLGLNALFWLFMPIKLGRALTGDITGMEEVTRLLSLRPFDINTIRSFLNVFYNQRFFLDKFIVMTPFSFGLCFMAAAWYGMVSCFTNHRRSAYSLAFASIACAGMLFFHPVVGVAVVAGLTGGHVLLLLTRSKVTDPTFSRTSLALLGAAALAVLVASPYLYLLVQGGGSEQSLPIGLSLKRTVGIVISCALVAYLAAWQVKRLLAERTPAARYFVLAGVSIILVSLLMVLPGPNKYGKPPFFVFYPLAVAGGWTLVDFATKGTPFFRKKSVVALIFVLLFLPVNLLALAAYFNTPADPGPSAWERSAVDWARTNTSRDAVFIDSGDRVLMAIEGPRRYYFGVDAYAEQWGYDTAEMERRRRAVRNLYSLAPLEQPTLAALAEFETDVYIIVRDDDERYAGLDRFSKLPDFFAVAYGEGPISVLKVDKEACRNSSGP
jgi:hypothetical protein